MNVLRDLQTAFDVADERHVGPMPQSIVAGDNSALIASIAPLYLTGSVLDVTYGRGVWWRRFKPEQFTYHDLALDGVDCRELPYEASTFDTVCFDPPYIPTRGAHTASPKLKGRFRASYGLMQPRTAREVEDLVSRGLAEAARVTRQWVLAKTCDYAENGHVFKLGHVSAIAAGEAAGLRVHDLIVHHAGVGPGGGRITEIRRARRAHSYLVVFAKRRRRQSRNQERVA